MQESDSKEPARASRRFTVSRAVRSGLTPLASEWWHFDDWDARRLIDAASNGRYRLDLPE